MMKRGHRNWLVWSMSLSVMLGAGTRVDAQSLTWLGTLPDGTSSGASGVSADGAVVVGTAVNSSGLPRAFRWTASGGMQDLGTLQGFYDSSYASGVSADGAVVVGWASHSSQYFWYSAFRWENGGMQNLGTLPGYNVSSASGVSADGLVVVGGARNASGQDRAFRWTASDGMQDIGTLPGGTYSEAWGVSADGSVVVGWSNNASGYGRAFRWENGVMQDLGTLGGNSSEAHGVSADGSVVVGEARNASGQRLAFRWTASGGMQDLGTLPGYNESYASGVSSDGSVVVGMAYNTTPYFWYHAFRWTASGGMEDLNSTYASLLTNGSELLNASAISPDGRYIVGRGLNGATGREEAYLLDTGPRCISHNGDADNNGCVDDADLLQVLFAFGQSGNALGRVDVNCDGTVDDADLLQVLFNFGSGC